MLLAHPARYEEIGAATVAATPDLNNQLQSILLNLELLRSDWNLSPHNAPEVFESIAATQRVIDIVRGLLDGEMTAQRAS